MGEVNKRYFEALMEANGMSLRALAARMGLAHSQLSVTFSGARKMQLDEAAQLSQIFNEPLHKIVENAGVATRPASGKRVAVIGAVHGDGTVVANPKGVVERTGSVDNILGETVAIQCRTAGTPLDWMDGWVLFCRPPHGVDAALLGRFCYIKLKDGPAAVAAVRRGYRDGTFNLSGPFSRESAVLEWGTPILLTRN